MDRLTIAVKDGLVKPYYGTLPVQCQLLLKQILKLTPAKTEDQQRHAIRNDLLNIFELRREEVVRLAVARHGSGRIDAWIHDSRTDQHAWVSVAGVAIDTTTASKIHSANYTSRGRTRKLAGGKAAPGDKNPKKGFKYLIAPRVFAEYLNEVYKQVGIARAGWLPAAMALNVETPKYVSRHAPGDGFYVDGLAAERPYIEVQNTSRWAKLRDEGERIVNAAIGGRMRAAETYVRKQMELAKKKAGIE